MHRVTHRVTAALLTLALALPAAAADIRVDAAGTSAVEDGSAASPFRTIQPALAAAVAGDRVVVAPGIYYGAIELKSGVPLVGEAGPKLTIIDGLGASVAVGMPYDSYPNVSLEGFTVRGADMAFYATNRVNFWGGSRLAISNAVIRDVRLAIESMPMAQVIVTKSVITSVDLVVDAIWCTSPQFVNVTVDRVSDAWGQGAFKMYQTGASLTNVTLSNAPAAFGTWGHRGSAYIWGSGNNLWNVPTLGVPGWNGQLPYVAWSAIQADPLFVNAAAGDFRLSAGSALIDAGVDVGLPFQGAAPDIGAIESGITIEDAANALKESFAAVVLPAFKNNAEQRLHAMSNKMLALIVDLAEISPTAPVADQLLGYNTALAKLEGDIWGKADGFFGGNPTNDWIVTMEEQARLKPKVDELRDLIKAEIARLSTP